MSAARINYAPQRLTARMKQVAALIALGATKSEVAAELHLSERTVKSYADEARQRLGVARSRHFAKALVEQGYATPDELIHGTVGRP